VNVERASWRSSDLRVACNRRQRPKPRKHRGRVADVTFGCRRRCASEPSRSCGCDARRVTSRVPSGACDGARVGQPAFGQVLRDRVEVGDRPDAASAWPSLKRGEPHIGCRVQQTCGAPGGGNRRSREERQGRNESEGWHLRAEGSWMVPRHRRQPGVDTRCVCRWRGDLWTTP